MLASLATAGDAQCVGHRHSARRQPTRLHARVARAARRGRCEGVNAMPQRLQLEFLESLGANILPPQPARAPLVFQLLETASDDATVPAGTRVAAVLPPPPPSLESDTPPKRVPPPEFFTEQEITAMRGKLATVYSIDPQADTYADHTGDATTGFTVFDNQRPIPHRLYLGHGELFKLTGSAQIVLSFDFAPLLGRTSTIVQRPLLLNWEYLSTDGWQPLDVVEDGTRRFTRDGKVTLIKRFGPDSKEDVVAGRTSYWIRATVSNRTPLARLSTEPAGYLLRFVPGNPLPTLQAGDEVRITGETATSALLAAGEGRIVVNEFLQGAKANANLETKAGAKIGTILSAPAFFRLAVESARELLPGDMVTVDGARRAKVEQTDEESIYLTEPLDGAQPGLTVELADALPPLRPNGADENGVLPQVDVIRARVGLGQDDLPPDKANLDGFQLDISKDFPPFGEQPVRSAAFYLACNDAFSRRGARIDLHFTFTQLGNDRKNARVQAEYFNGQRWTALTTNDEYNDGSANLTHGTSMGGSVGPWTATISFTGPTDWTEYELNGDKQVWLRLRLTSGDYGQPLAVSVVPDPTDNSKVIVQATASDLQPPIIARLAISFRYFTNPQALEFCVTENDFAFTDHSEDARWPRSPFAPFTPVADRSPALQLGFSSKPPTALVSVLVHVIVPAMEGDRQPFVWDYWGSRGWTELSVRDATLGLRQTGLVQFVGPSDALPRDGLGGGLYRIRARLKSGLASQDEIVQCGGVWLNAVWARQGKYIERDGLGISSGNPDQTFALPIVRAAKAMPVSSEDVEATNIADFERALNTPLAGVPILGDEKVEVREWSGRGDDWKTVLGDLDLAQVRFEVDPQDPTIKTAAWVRWKARPHFYRSGPNDRHYVVERARGVFRFPGTNGYIPPAGAPIVASYITGGGVDGNVPAGAVRELRSGVGFVQSVSNPLAASGGAAAELLRATRDRSAHVLRHRDRAVSVEDYEWLAMSASSEVARVRALPLEGPAGRGGRGFVGIVLVSHSSDAQPMPSPELRRGVINVLARCVPAGIASGIRIVSPSYVPVSVRAELLPFSADDSGLVETRVRSRLTQFLHPLTGGHDGHGWKFGESVYLSDLAAVIEATPGVDAVRFLQLMVGQSVYVDSVPVEPHQLIAAGDPQLKIIVPSVPYALA
jgi:baseplate J-like protein